MDPIAKLPLFHFSQWRLVVYMDGRENQHKVFENQRRQRKSDKARAENNLRGQVQNTPEYIAKATAICHFFGIDVRVSAFEADPQVASHALHCSFVCMTGDSDLLAYGPRIRVRDLQSW